MMPRKILFESPCKSLYSPDRIELAAKNIPFKNAGRIVDLVKRITLTDTQYKRLQVCLRFCKEDLSETGGFLEVDFSDIGEAKPKLRERTTLRKVQILQVAVETNTEEVPET